MFCYNCGIKIEQSDCKFCPECGVAIKTLQTNNNAVNHQLINNELLDSITHAKSFVDDIYSIHEEIGQLENARNELLVKIHYKQKEFPNTVSVAWIIVLLFSQILVTIAASYNGYQHLYAMIVIEVIVYIIVSVLLLFRDKRITKNFKKKQDKEIEEIDTEIGKTTENIQMCFYAIKDKIEIPDGQYVLSYIPKDYFYPAAIERFLFYIRNGHANSMKEAVKEYDQYIHRCKMEYEATRTATATEQTRNAAERTAAASEQIVVSAERLANNSASANASLRAIEQDANNVNFWITYSAMNNL